MSRSHHTLHTLHTPHTHTHHTLHTLTHTTPPSPMSYLYDLPLSLDIEFSIIAPEPEDDIYAYTRTLCGGFDPRALRSIDGAGIYVGVDEEHIYNGIDFEMPSCLNYDFVPAHPRGGW